jgi:hypothetical protein
MTPDSKVQIRRRTGSVAVADEELAPRLRLGAVPGAADERGGVPVPRGGEELEHGLEHLVGRRPQAVAAAAAAPQIRLPPVPHAAAGVFLRHQRRRRIGVVLLRIAHAGRRGGR